MTDTASPIAAPVQGESRSFIEATFQVGGLRVFGPIVEEVGLAGATITMRNLQLLYWLRSQHPLTRPEVIREMAAWRGTGRNDVVAFEPSVTASALLDGMVKDDLLWEMGSPTKRVLVSPKGIALLTRLHPACEDMDLPWRLIRWEQAWPASELEAERYVRSFIGRQRGYASTG